MNKRHNQPSKQGLDQQGFTILELLIATMIFSVILLLCAFGLMQIGRTYYRGITSSRTQATARAISDDIAQAIQYGGDIIQEAQTPPTFGQSSTPPGAQTVRIGDREYTYRLGAVLVPQGTNPLPTGTATEALQVRKVDSNGVRGEPRELLNTRMWLSKFNVRLVDSRYEIDIQVVNGDHDQVIDANGRSFGDSTFDVSTIKCRPGAGSQFCAISGLHTAVVRRL